MSVADGTAASLPLKLTLGPNMEVKQGQKLELTVKATRKPEFKDNIVVAVPAQVLTVQPK